MQNPDPSTRRRVANADGPKQHKQNNIYTNIYNFYQESKSCEKPKNPFEFFKEKIKNSFEDPHEIFDDNFIKTIYYDLSTEDLELHFNRLPKTTWTISDGDKKPIELPGSEESKELEILKEKIKSLTSSKNKSEIFHVLENIPLINNLIFPDTKKTSIKSNTNLDELKGKLEILNTQKEIRFEIYFERRNRGKSCASTSPIEIKPDEDEKPKITNQRKVNAFKKFIKSVNPYFDIPDDKCEEIFLLYAAHKMYDEIYRENHTLNLEDPKEKQKALKEALESQKALKEALETEISLNLKLPDVPKTSLQAPKKEKLESDLKKIKIRDADFFKILKYLQETENCYRDLPAPAPAPIPAQSKTLNPSPNNGNHSPPSNNPLDFLFAIPNSIIEALGCKKPSQNLYKNGK